MNLNKCQFIGHLGKDPEIRHTQSGDAVASFSIAVDKSYKKENGEVVKKTEWINCVAWKKLAEIIEKYVFKGSEIYVCGEMVTRSWEDKEGNKRYTTEIIVNEMQMGKKPESKTVENKPEQKQEKPYQSDVPLPGDDDLPF